MKRLFSKSRPIQSALCGLLTSFTLLSVNATADELQFEEVLNKLKQFYPPYLAAIIEEDIADARVRSAIGGFDSTIEFQAQLAPENFYDGSYYELMFNRPFETIGGNFFAGYRLSEGFLPDYKRAVRSGRGGEAVLGFDVSLLKDRTIDGRRAKLRQSEIDRLMAKPGIQFQQVEIIRLARLAYYHWVIRSKILEKTKLLLENANERQKALELEVAEGARPEIVLVDNQRLVIERQIAVIKEEQALENASLALALFYRSTKDSSPIYLKRDRIPNTVSIPLPTTLSDLAKHQHRISLNHPQLRKLDLMIKRWEIDVELAKNNLKPDLSLAVELNQSLTGNTPSDIDETELTTLLKFGIPLGQNEAKGQRDAALSKIEQIVLEKKFKRESLRNSLQQAHNSMLASYQGIDLAEKNVGLARQLFEAEQEMFAQGASDLLKLQLREQAAFSSELTYLSAVSLFMQSYADYHAIAVTDLTSF